MSDAPDRIFVSIGVSQPDGGLDVLPGAINAARRMANWAQGQNYRIVLVHDKVQQKFDDGFDYDGVEEVTTELLRTEIVKAIDEITSERELKRLVVFFAGHGAALAIGDQYWILSNWDRSPTEAIKVSGLQRMLEYYGPLRRPYMTAPHTPPATRLLRIEEVINRVALSRASIYAAIKAGTFPAQKKISARAVRWQESEINAWIDAFAQA